MENNLLSEAENVFKSFGSTKALADVSLKVRHGEIHGLIGENGSGKSTLSTIIAGTQRFDKGIMKLEGNEYKPSNVLDANSKGISMIVQEQGTINGITVAANLFAGKEGMFTKYGILDTKKLRKDSKKALENIGASHIKPDDMINNLSFEDRKLVEIARAMLNDSKLLIIDETTTSLSEKGRKILYNIMNSLRDNGKSILFISHDIDELIEMCDAVTILRDGHITGVLEKDEMSPKRMKELMVGRDISDNFYRNDYECNFEDEVCLSVNNIAYGSTLKNITFDVHKGEILGIGGLTECGMHELGKIMYGALRPDKGHVSVANGEIIKKIKSALKNDIGYISKDRDGEALMLLGSIKDNICLPSLDKTKKKGLIFNKTQKEFIEPYVKKLSIKMASSDEYCMYLSGGNKQKVSIAKWLAKDSKIIIMDCPTRGIDVGVKSDIYKLMMELKKAGKSIIMISEELPELIGMSDRMLIIKDGIISGQFERSKDINESMLIHYMI